MLQTDLHCHLLPGVDDGCRSTVETVLLAKGLVALGIHRVYVTPHQFRFGNSLSGSTIEFRAQAVRRLLQEAGVALEVRVGAEHLYGTRLLEAIDGDEELVTLSFAQRRCILIELPFRQPAVGVRRLGALLLERGIQPILAHPERSVRARRDIRRVMNWHAAGWWFQLNVRALVGDYGGVADYVATQLLMENAYAALGSDAHRPVDLVRLQPAYQRCREIVTEFVQ